MCSIWFGNCGTLCQKCGQINLWSPSGGNLNNDWVLCTCFWCIFLHHITVCSSCRRVGVRWTVSYISWSLKVKERPLRPGSGATPQVSNAFPTIKVPLCERPNLHLWKKQTSVIGLPQSSWCELWSSVWESSVHADYSSRTRESCRS